MIMNRKERYRKSEKSTWKSISGGDLRRRGRREAGALCADGGESLRVRARAANLDSQPTSSAPCSKHVPFEPRSCSNGEPSTEPEVGGWNPSFFHAAFTGANSPVT